LRAGFEAAVNYAIEKRARLFLQVGDLFDTPTPSNEDRAFVASALARLARADVLCAGIGGNHDTPRMVTEQGGAAPQGVYEALNGMRYFSRHDAVVPYLYTIGGVRIALAGLSNNPVAPPGSDPLEGIPIVDEQDALGQAQIALLLLHAGIEGMCRPSEGERIVKRSSVAALPPVFVGVVAGHIHRFAHERIGKRTAVVTGATERMEFGSGKGGSGFVWMELDATGVRRVEHIAVAEQPRADLLVPTARLWPGGVRWLRDDERAEHVDDGATVTDNQAGEIGAGDETLRAVASESEWPAGATGNGHTRAIDASGQHWQAYVREPENTAPLDVIKEALAEVCSPETMVRLRLSGPLTRDQYHDLALRDVLLYGQQHAFSFDLDTSDLMLLHLDRARSSEAPRSARVSPLEEVERVLEERLARPDERSAEWEREQRDAASLLRDRLQSAMDREAGT
jgi:DNA repair exonuclease SbcCD nuclease subunit